MALTMTKFKQTEIGEIPNDWEVVRLGEVSEIVGGGTPSTSAKEYWNGSIPFVIPTDVTNLKSNFLEQTANYITDLGLKDSSAKLIPEGAVLVTSRATIGFCAINKVPVATNQGFASIICKDRIHNQFLLYYVRFIKSRLESLASGSTFKEVSKTSLRKLKLPFPPILEQRKIAEILSTADEAIQKTDEVIAKAEELKKGLMQELLTKGVISGFMFDTTVFNDIHSKKIDIRRFPKQFNYFITHVQFDELNKTPDKERKRKLLGIFKNIDKTKLPTESGVWGVSRWGEFKWGSERDKTLEQLRKDNLRHTEDALIGETAIKQGLILVTDDEKLLKRVKALGGQAITLEDFFEGKYKEFKDSEIGRIPKGWEVVRLGEVAIKFISGGTPSTSRSAYWNGNIHWMRSASITNRFVDSGEKYITEEGLRNSATNIVPKGGVLVATRVCIGNVAVNRIDVAISQDLTGVVLKAEKAFPEYVYWALRIAENRIKSLIQGSTIKGVLREDLKNIELPLPPLPEQQKIAEILATVDGKLEKERERKGRLEELKKGLMQVLLTGKVRVKVN